jgi:MFS family permease
LRAVGLEMSRPTSPAAEEESADRDRTPDRYHLLRNRNFVCFLSGRFIASFGGQMLAAAVGWDIYERTHSALPLGLVGLAQIAPLLLMTLPAGHAADNFPRKTIILLSQALMFASCAALAVVALTRAPVWWMYLFLFLNGMARTFLWPASAAFLPQLVARADFPKAVAWNSTSFQLSAVLGPAIGGAIIAHFASAAPVYFLNAGASAAYSLLITLVKISPATLARQKMTLKTLLAGFRFVYKTRLILGVITLDLFAVLFGGATALLPIYASDILHRGPASLGLLQSALPLGSFVMAFVLAHRAPMQKAGTALLGAVTIFGVATIAFGLSHNFWFSFFAMAVCGAVDNISIVVRHTLVQLLTPDEMRGRVSAVNSLFIGTSNEFGDFESGFVAHLTGPVWAVVSGGVGTLLVVAAVAYYFPEIRKRGSLTG